MFDIATLKGKLIIAAILLAVIGGLSFGVKHYYDKCAELETEITRLEKENKDLKDKIDLLDKSNKIDNSTINNNCKDTKELRNKNDSISTDVDKKIDSIRDHYKGISGPPKVLANVMEREISQARVIGLWRSYCIKHNDDSGCAVLVNYKE